LEGLFSFLLKLIDHVESHVVTENLFAAGDHVVLTGRTQGRVVGSDATFDMPIVHLWTLREPRSSLSSPTSTRPRCSTPLSR